jgi:hypothetical protein
MHERAVFYNIHGLVKIKISGPSYFTDLVNSFLIAYKNEQLIPDEDIDIEFIDLKYFKPEEIVFDLQNELYYFSSENSLIYSSKLKLAIAIKDNKFTIFAARNLDRYTFDLLLQFKLVSKGYSLSHASGLVLKGDGIIFPAHPGAGKTRIINYMTNVNDVGLLGDEYIIISKSGYVFSYCLPMWVFHYHTSDDLPEIKKLFNSKGGFFSRKYVSSFYNKLTSLLRPTLKQILPLSWWSIIRKYAPSGAAVLHIQDIVSPDRIPNSVIIKKAVFLIQHNEQGCILEPFSKDDLINESIGVLHSSVLSTQEVQNLLLCLIGISSFINIPIVSNYYNNVFDVFYSALKNAQTFRLQTNTKAKAKELGQFVYNNLL